MKRISFIFILFFLFTIISSGIFAQIDDSEKVKERLQELFELCLNDDYSEAASYFVYRGQDTSRKWIDVYCSENEEDMKEVRGLCNRIKGYIYENLEYSFYKYYEEEESEKEWFVWELWFTHKEEQPRIKIFRFLIINNEYALGDFGAGSFIF